MQKEVDKLIELSGNEHLYQYIVAIACFIFWCNVNIFDFSLGFLESTSFISYYNEAKNETVVESLDYDICNAWDPSKYTIVDQYEFSLAIDLNIECNQLKVSLLGTLGPFGLLLGATTYSYITKALGQKNTLLLANVIFIITLTLTLFITEYWYICIAIVICPYMCNIISYSTMVLFSEIISERKKAILNTFINSGLGIGGLFYCLMFYVLRKWKYVFIVSVGISVILEIFVFFIIENSFKEYTDKKDINGMLKALRFIAKINKKIVKFNEQIGKKEYQLILKELRGGEDLIPSTPKENDILNVGENIPELNLDKSKSKEKTPIQLNTQNNVILYTDDGLAAKGDCNEINDEPAIRKKSTSTVEEEKPKITTTSSNNEEQREITPQNICSLFKYPSVRYTFILFCVLWFLNTALLNGLTIGLKLLPGNIYINSICLFCAESPGYFVSGIAMNSRLGRKYSLIIFTSIFSITNVLLYILYNNETASIVIYLITRFFVCSAFCIYYTYAYESYPLSVAQIAYGINGGCNCIGGIVVPFIIEYINKRTLYLIYFLFSIVCVVLMFFLKETRGVKQPEQIKEVEEVEKEKKSVEMA